MNQYHQWQDLKSDSPKQDLYNRAEYECRYIAKVFCDVMKACKDIEPSINDNRDKEKLYAYVEELVYMKNKFFYEDYIEFIDKLDFRTLVILITTSEYIKELCFNLLMYLPLPSYIYQREFYS